MLADCSEQSLTLEQRNSILSQRLLENHLYAEYNKIREKLLEAAKVGYGNRRCGGASPIPL